MYTNKATLLIVSDVKENIQYFYDVLKEYCIIRTAENAEDAKHIMETIDDVILMLVDLRDYVTFLKETRKSLGVVPVEVLY